MCKSIEYVRMTVTRSNSKSLEISRQYLCRVVFQERFKRRLWHHGHVRFNKSFTKQRVILEGYGKGLEDSSLEEVTE